MLVLNVQDLMEKMVGGRGALCFPQQFLRLFVCVSVCVCADLITISCPLFLQQNKPDLALMKDLK